MKYRSDIQFLRGLAVLFVVVFHLGFEFLKSGYLGVDIFFVISGFLISTLYVEGNIFNFYYKRGLRILPAYYVVVIVTLLVSYLTLTENETNQVLSQSKYASVFLSNIGFWSQSSYFSKDNFNPLLHLWSLGLEVQFYLVFPLIYWLLKKQKMLMLAVFFVSLTACFLMIEVSPKTSFFMLPMRLWEFLAGCIMALYFTDKGVIKNKKNSFIGFLGLFIILIIPIYPVDGDSLNVIDGHPGLFALIIVFSSSLILIFGLPIWCKNLIIYKAIGVLGKYSYSIYLVHFPIIVIYLSKPFSGTILSIESISDGLTIMSMIVISTLVVYHLIESKSKFFSIESLLILWVVLILLIFSLPVIKSFFNTKSEDLIFSANSDRGVYRCGKIFRILNPKNIVCDLTKDITNPKQKIILVGNSHADALKETLRLVSKEHESKLYFMVPNNPLMIGGMSPEKLIKEANNLNVDKLVMHYSPSAISNETISDLIKLSRSFGIKIYFIEPVPIWENHIPMLMYKRNKGEDIEESKNIVDYYNENNSLIKFLRKNKNDLVSISVVKYFCDPDCKYQSSENKPLYFDDGHLTITGSQLIKKAFEPIFLNDLQM